MCDEYLQRKLPEEVIGRLKLYIYIYILLKGKVNNLEL